MRNQHMNFSRLIAIIIFALIFTFPVVAQRGSRLPVSPEIGAGKAVTFRILAPKVDKVAVTGSWMPGWGGSVELTKNDTGLWSVTIDPLPSEMYTYSFLIDGVRALDNSNPIVVRDGTRNESMFIIPGGNADLYSVADVPHGNLEKVWSPSPSLGIDRRMYVYTPPGYSGNTKLYPVFYLLHGAGGDEDAWTTLGRTPYILDNLIAAGKAEPMIVVMTNGNPTTAAAIGEEPAVKKNAPAAPAGPGGMANGKFEESLVKDIIPFVEKHYRVLADKDHRAIAGLSMGGFHTQNITNANPGKFAYIGVMSMGLWDATRFGGPDNSKLQAQQIDVLKNSGVKLYWIGCGKEDFLYESVTNLRKFYDQHNLKYVYRESTGGHTWTNWRIYLTELAPMLFK